MRSSAQHDCEYTLYAPCQPTFITAAHPSGQSRVSLIRATTVQASYNSVCKQQACSLQTHRGEAELLQNSNFAHCQMWDALCSLVMNAIPVTTKSDSFHEGYMHCNSNTSQNNSNQYQLWRLWKQSFCLTQRHKQCWTLSHLSTLHERQRWQSSHAQPHQACWGHSHRIHCLQK